MRILPKILSQSRLKDGEEPENLEFDFNFVTLVSLILWIIYALGTSFPRSSQRNKEICCLDYKFLKFKNFR